MPQLIRLITLSHIYAAANSRAGEEATSPHKVLAISEKKH